MKRVSYFDIIGSSFIVIILIVILWISMTLLPAAGCSLANNGWQNNTSQSNDNIFLTAKIGTRMALTKLEISSRDLDLVEKYLIASRDLLTIPGQPNFAGARILARENLSEKCLPYGLTIIDLLENHLETSGLNIMEDQELVLELISSGINGALEAVREFKN